MSMPSLVAVLVLMVSLTISNMSVDVSSDEWVEITNTANTGEDVDLFGYVLSDAQGHEYTFGHVVLPAGDSIKVHTGIGTDNATDVFWGRRAPVWNNEGDIIRLSNGEDIIAERAYGDAIPPPSSRGAVYVWGVSLSTIVLVAAMFINSLLRRKREVDDEMDWSLFIEKGAGK